MSKKKEIMVTMPNPCTKREWDDMTHNASGRHCSNCDFTVIDFTNYTDKELVDFLLKSKGKLCGMFENYQLNRPMTIAPEKTNTLLNRALLSAALIAAVATTVNGQTDNSIQTPAQNELSQEKSAKGTIHVKAKQEIKGIITDKKTKEPIKNVSILLQGNIINTQSNADGTFLLAIPDSMLSNTIVVVINAYGYKSLEFTLEKGKIQSYLTVALKQKRIKHSHKTYRTIGCPSF
jgi:hypothetical protein